MPPRWITPIKWLLFAIAGVTLWVTFALALAFPGPLPRSPRGWLLLVIGMPILYLLAGLVGYLWKAPARSTTVLWFRRFLMLAAILAGLGYLGFLADPALMGG